MTTLTNKSLSIFFPVYNEAENIKKVITDTLSIADELSPDIEIIIVNDGSSDNTEKIVNELSKYDSRIRIINHPCNKGYGAALQSGFRAAEKDLIFYTDGDGQFSIFDLRELLQSKMDADVISCYRMNRKDPWHRILNAKIFEFCVWIIFGLKIKDPDCAFKLYCRDVVDEISMTSQGAMIDVEMLLQAKRYGFQIMQKGVNHYPRRLGSASGANFKVIFKAIVETVQLWWRVGGRFS